MNQWTQLTLTRRAMESFFSLLQRMSWTAAAGADVTISGSLSSPGLKGPTTADAKSDSAD